jgi:hypothetical protein
MTRLSAARWRSPPPNPIFPTGVAVPAMDKTDITTALNDRNVRIASLIIEGLRHWGDVIDEQPSQVLEVLIEHVRTLQRPGAPRYALRAALIRHLETALEEATAREERLRRAITGE